MPRLGQRHRSKQAKDEHWMQANSKDRWQGPEQVAEPPEEMILRFRVASSPESESRKPTPLRRQRHSTDCEEIVRWREPVAEASERVLLRRGWRSGQRTRTLLGEALDQVETAAEAPSIRPM